VGAKRKYKTRKEKNDKKKCERVIQGIDMSVRIV
jgi:hypothetical protein